MLKRPLSFALSLSLLVPQAWAAKDEAEKPPEWNVESSLPAEKSVRFTTSEGTWMNLDVSPDGKTVVFDMLGDLYLLPIAGGKARNLTSGRAFDVQPRFSPDGKQVAFTSDRAGGNNLWRIDINGSDATQVSKEDFRLLNNPAWTPDGQYLVARKHFSSERSLGAGEQWLYHASGGEGLQLTKKKNDQQDQGEPALSPDGRYLYFSEDMSGGSTFQYNKNPHALIYAIRRLDRETGEIIDLISSNGGAVRPQPSPDGKSLAFVKRVREKTVLHVLDLESGVVRPLWDGLNHDQQEAWAIFGSYPNFQWLPDASALVIWAQGGLWRIEASSGEAKPIPFEVDVERAVAKPLRFEQSLPSGQFTAQMLRDIATAPDGKQVVFHAVGQLWTRALPNGKPQRLTADAANFEYQPSFSRDGRKLLYTRWNDEDLVRVVERDLASGSERVVDLPKGYYYGPAYSPDGSLIVLTRGGGSGLTGGAWSADAGVYVLPTVGGKHADGKLQRIANGGGAPQFNADGTRIFYFTGDGLAKKLMSIGLAGEQPREVFNLKYPNLVSISPDGRWVAFTELFNAYVAPMPQTGASIELSKDTKAIPVAQVSRDAGSYLHWSADSKRLHWAVGERYFTRELQDTFGFVAGAPKTLPKIEDAKGIALGLSQPVYAPDATVAFTGARIITMRDSENTQEVIEDGVLLIKGDSIVAVGASGAVRVPDGSTVIDARGKTIIPGMVDAHAHVAHFGGGVIPQANWAYYANLAFGITTAHDPSATNEFVFSQAELVRAGRMVGPRVFSTGTILYGADGDFKAVIDSLDDARSHLRRMKALGAFSVKSYNQPRRDQRQQINQAARELEMLVVEEGGSTFFHNLTMVIDGATGVEHNLPIAPLYRDVIQLMAGTDVRNTPTLVVSYGGLSGERWFYARDRVWEDAKLNRFFPRETLEGIAIRREIAPDWDYYHVEVAKAVKQLRDAGVRIQVGGHGQMQGLAPHWETWMLHQGGFSPFEALRAATFDGADYLGLGKQLGSLEAGKRADLVVLNNNPLEDIRASADTHMVMVNGRLFDTATMAEVGGQSAPAPVFHWQRQPAGHAFGIEYGPTAVCHCPKSGVGHPH